MKIIDLLNKIANGEIPKTIVYDERYFTYDDKRQNYFAYDDSEIDWKYTIMEYINDEIEIIEDTPKEENKIPLKINKIIPSQNYVISDSKNKSVDERLEIIRKRLYANELYMLDIANTLNEIIDYLKSKGE